MALTGLRGKALAQFPPAPYQQMRDNREMQAQQVLAQREEREERKENDKRQKEADRKLKEEV